MPFNLNLRNFYAASYMYLYIFHIFINQKLMRSHYYCINWHKSQISNDNFLQFLIGFETINWLPMCRNIKYVSQQKTDDSTELGTEG